MATDKPDTVDLYRCLTCGHLRICERGNHHPWCLFCVSDLFDWSNGYEDITREEAERIMRED